jgi:hypothetical protein
MPLFFALIALRAAFCLEPLAFRSFEAVIDSLLRHGRLR